MYQNRNSGRPSTVHDKVYWDKLWTRQERTVEQAKTPIVLRDSGPAEPIKFFVR